MNIAEFANVIKIRSEPAALLIGFDGGAALVNHHRPGLVRDELLPGPGTTSYDQNAIRRAWRQLGSQRRNFMMRHTETADAEQPDTGAIGCIARLVTENYIRAIVATDNSKVLYRALSAHIPDLDRYECTGGRANVLAAKSAERIFVDSGELTLKGFDPSIYGDEGAELSKMRDALRKFLGLYDCLFCWGWCELNAPITWICEEKPPPYFTAIGRYTSPAISRQADMELVERSDDQDVGATTEVWYELTSTLFPVRRGPVSVIPGRARVVAEYAEAGEIDRSRPLLSRETLRDIEDKASANTVSFIGVEGESVRHICSRWLAMTLRQKGERPLACDSGSETEDFTRYVTMTLESNEPVWVIGMLGNGIGSEARWTRELLPAVRGLREKGRRGPPAQEYHAAFFVPLPVAAWVKDQFPGESTFWVKSFFEADFLVPDILAEWLLENIGSQIELTSARAHALALTMTRSALMPRPTDWLHEAIFMWHRKVLRLAQEASDTTSLGGREISLEDLVDTWDELCGLYRKVEDGLRMDFDLGPVQSRSEEETSGRAEGTEPPTQADAPDFALGEPTPRTDSEPDGPETPDTAASDGTDGGADDGPR